MNTMNFSRQRLNKKEKIPYRTKVKYEWRKFKAGRNPAIIIFRISKVLFNFLWGNKILQLKPKNN